MPADRPLDILQISTRDIGGGAERIAHDLFRTYRDLGHRSTLAVGFKRGVDADVIRLANHETGGTRAQFFWRWHQRLQRFYGRRWWAKPACRLAQNLAAPDRRSDVRRGVEDFNYPGTWRVADVLRHSPDVVHAHNLHGGYFDLRALPSLSQRLPTVLTLHDAWLLSGHCAHSLECDRWRTGCGGCPDLTLYPAIRRDATDFNWRRKRDLYQTSRLHVATPCRWLMRRVEASMLAPGVVESRVIPYGVDLNVFQPADRPEVREALDLPSDVPILLFAANSIRRNPWKDFATMRAAVARLAGRWSTSKTRPDERVREARRSESGSPELLFVALGETARSERIGKAEVRFVPFTNDPTTVARYYQAADVYVHAARVDTFPNAVLEALACGTPVVATAVGGIPEQVKSLSQPSGDTAPDVGTHAAEDATGVLVSGGDAEAMATAIETLLRDDALRMHLSDNAARDARVRFDLRRHAEDYLDWYRSILDRSSEAVGNAPWKDVMDSGGESKSLLCLSTGPLR